ncbi:MAG TPA: PQQ-dependent sugar dehydrogenase [Blastocatellia bacterium]|nr:PQQ-dependent sugar dehydrogenase [Blastocatellia bacterium]
MTRARIVLLCTAFATLVLSLHATSNRAGAQVTQVTAQDFVPSAVGIQLQPVLTTGLSSPLFVGNAHDGSNRLFIVEQTGAIKVLHAGSSTPTVFLDISLKVVSGGEQGLLGLAFHPQFSSNRRFFVDYTRQGDGATVIAEYHASANPDVADPAETVLLTIPQPFPNHNGGMLAFGPDGFLYIGMGDGGSANDPGNRAQDINQLLGKILRIDIDHAGPSAPYTSPSTNPFFGSTPGRDEIFAYGVRNPWRFSFDRGTGSLYVGDVGQGAWEEVDIVTLGGNYGWRVLEGFHCTNIDPTLCSAGSFSPPILEYGHTGGRCSITGGYVYRGSLGSLPLGSYVFGDFCTGEIFLSDGTTQSLLLDTTLSISSFGEDEAGELYVVGLGGQVYRIASTGTPPPPPPPCTFSISPNSLSFPIAGGTGSVNVTAPSGCAWTVSNPAPWITLFVTGGSGNGTVTFGVLSNKKGGGPRSTTLTVAGQTLAVEQAGPTATCVTSLSPTDKTVPAAGGAGSFSVSAGGTCSWSALANAGWITITSGANGTGNGTVSFSVASNPDTTMRQATITVQSLAFTVNQAGQTCSFSLNPGSASLGAGGGAGSFGVNASAGCMWSAVSNFPWITVTSGASGTGSGTVNFSVSANASSTPRSGMITAGGMTFSVNQAGSPTPSCSFSISPAGASFAATAASGSIFVTTANGCSWTAMTSAPWISITSGASGSGSGTVSYTVQSNPNTTSRMATISVAQQSFTVSQSGATSSCSFSISPTSQTFTKTGGTGSITVTTGAGCVWSAMSDVSWITITSGSKGNGPGSIHFSVASNSTGPRSGTIKIMGLTFTVFQ